MKMSFNPSLSPIGLDLGSHSIKAVQLDTCGNTPKLTAAACLPRKNPGAPLDPQELSRLCAGLERQGFSGRAVVVATPAAKLMTSVLELPAKSSALPMDQIACAEFCRIHKADPDAVTMSYWELPASTRASRSTYAMAAGWLSSDANDFLDMLQEAGFSVDAVDVASSATARACQARDAAATDMTAILDLGWVSAVASIVKSEVLIYERRIPEAGLNNLVNAFVKEGTLQSRDAQYLIQQVGLSPTPDMDSDDLDLHDDCRTRISNHCAKMLDELRQAFSYALHQYPAAGMPTLLLCGGGAGIPGLAAHLQKALDMQVRLADPTNAITAGPAANSANAAGAVNSSMLTAIGLAKFGCEVMAAAARQ